MSDRIIHVLREADSPSATSRERFLLALALDLPEFEALAVLERERIRSGGRADYLPILSEVNFLRWTRHLGLSCATRCLQQRIVSGPLYQLLGSHNPYHFGHRVMLYSLLSKGLIGADLPARASVSTMGINSSKFLSMADYPIRHSGVIRALDYDPLLHGLPCWPVDLPTGIGLSRAPLFQSALLAALAGDDRIRVVMGSDKLLTDVGQYEARDAAALRKYDDELREFHIVVRQEDDEFTVREALGRLPAHVERRTFLLPKVNYEGNGVSSTTVRTLATGVDACDHALASLLVEGVPERWSELKWGPNMPRLQIVHPRANQGLAHNDAILGRYESEHGCIRFFVPDNEC
jgi:hypothetical protein